MIKSFAIIALTLVLAGSSFEAKSQIVGQGGDTLVLDRVLAVVGGHAIFQSDVESQYLTTKAMGYAIGSDMKCTIFEDMLVGKLLLDQSEIDSILVEDNEVESNVKQRIQGILANAGGDEELITGYYNKTMLEIEKDMFKPIKEQLLTKRMQDQITQGLRLTPSEVQKFYKKLSKDEIPIIPEMLELNQIVLIPKIPQEEHQRVQSRLNEFRDQIIGGQSMSTLAVLYSEDPGSASSGGEYGLTPRGTFVPEFASAAYKLEKGDVSRIVKTDFGYHIIELIERRGDMINVRHILMKPRIPVNVKIATKQELDSTASKIRNGEITFEDAAKAYSEDEKSRTNGGAVVNSQTGSTKFEPKDLDPGIMNAMKSLKVGEISEPFEAMDENGNVVFKVISLKSKVPAHQADVKEDYQFLYNMAMASKRQELIDKWVNGKKEGLYIRIHKDFQNCPFDYSNWLN